MAVVQMACEECGRRIEKEVKEVNRSRRMGRRFFCGTACSAAAGNHIKKLPDIVLGCPCGKRFVTTAKKKAAKHCSASCASRYSMSGYRRAAQRRAGLASFRSGVGNLLSPSEILKRREAWKYAALREALQGRPHEFEFKLGRFVFDLALLDTKTLVEFDGPYHREVGQAEVDRRKDASAAEAGYLVVRRSVRSATVVDPCAIEGL